jgi:hypothetical protein
MKPTMQVTGIKETLRELGKIDKEARRQITKDFKKIGAPVVSEAKNQIPKDPPLSGWGRSWSTGSGYQMLPWDGQKAAKYVDTKVSSKRPREFRGVVRDLAVVAIRWRGAVNTVFDMSREATTPQGQVMVNALNDRYGNASRIMYPAYEKHADAVEREIKAQVDQVMAMVNKAVK